jgi:hypothetical protein
MEVPWLPLAVRHPADWRRVPVASERTVHLTSPPRGAERFLPTLSLHARERENADERDLDRFAELQLAVSTSVLDDLMVLDSERTELAGHAARRLRLHHLVGAQSVTVDQWFAQPAGRVVVVSASTASADVVDREDVLARMVRSLELVGGAQG